MPLAPLRIDTYESRYGPSTAALIASKGRIAGEGELRGAQIWGNTVQSLADIAGNAIQSYPALKAQELQQQQAKLAAAETQRNVNARGYYNFIMQSPDAHTTDKATGQSMLNQDFVEKALTQGGYADRWPEIKTTLDSINANALGYKTARLKFMELHENLISDAARAALLAGGGPSQVLTMTADLARKGVFSDEEAKGIVDWIDQVQTQGGGDQPGNMVNETIQARLVQMMKPGQPKDRKTVNVSPGQTVIDPETGQQIYHAPEKETPPKEPKLTTVSPGNRLVDEQGNVIYTAPGKPESNRDERSDAEKVTANQRRVAGQARDTAIRQAEADFAEIVTPREGTLTKGGYAPTAEERQTALQKLNVRRKEIQANYLDALGLYDDAQRVRSGGSTQMTDRQLSGGPPAPAPVAPPVTPTTSVVSPSAATGANGLAVGAMKTLRNGQTVRVTKVYPDGSFDGEPVR